MVSELYILRENGIKIRHLAFIRVATRVHQHVANDIVGPLAVFTYLRDTLLQVLKDFLNIFRFAGRNSFALFREGCPKFVNQPHRDFREVSHKVQRVLDLMRDARSQ